MTEKKKKKKSATKPLLILLLVVIILALLGYIFLDKFNEPFDSQATETVHVTVSSGMGTTAIGEMLEEQGIIKNALLFKLKSRVKGYEGKYQAGSFELSSAMRMEDIMTFLMDGKKESVRFTIPEGYNLEQTATKLSEEGFVDVTEFMYELKNGDFNYRFLDDLKKEENWLEGFLFPDTYEIFKDAAEKDIINKMLAGFDAVFTDAYYEKAKEMGLSVKEVVTIASLIEEETKSPEERTLVSSVIYNRLDIGMNLRFCSTVLYALGEQKPRLSYKDLEVNSPYNTYKMRVYPPVLFLRLGKPASMQLFIQIRRTIYFL